MQVSHNELKQNLKQTIEKVVNSRASLVLATSSDEAAHLLYTLANILRLLKSIAEVNKGENLIECKDVDDMFAKLEI